jgi:vancomycin resistance protein YoaR
MRRYVIAAAIGIPMLLVVFIAAGYVSDETIGTDRVSRGVTAAGMDLSRLTEDDATDVITDYEAALSQEPLVVIVEGSELLLSPADAGFAINEEAVVADAMAIRRADALFSNVGRWLSTFSSRVEVAIPSTVDEEALTAILDMWTETVLDTPAYEGAVKIANGEAVPEYPESGLRIDVPNAISLIGTQLARSDRAPVVLPLIPIEPQITDNDVDEAVHLATTLIGTPVVLRSAAQPGTIVFTSAGLATALHSELVYNSPASLEVSLDEDTLREIASRSATAFVVPPVDATFTFDEVTRELAVVPSVVGQQVDLARIPEIVIAAAQGSGRGTIPMTDGDEAELTTTQAEAMRPLGEVSTFTTTHPCCQSRITNIQLLADEIGGAVVLPGEEFSVNDRAGQRTLSEGYVRAGAIINGRVQCCDSSINIGGGTSQFATTFYNAVFFGCYEDVFHQPHSLYFSRYPFVREATLGFPAPDVKFRNDSDAIVYIHTEYTSSSITVTLYGNNGGRTCTSERSGNTITRVMEHPDGSVTTQDWTWNYRKPKPEPAPTATTIPATTTTTLAGTTTTAPATTTTTTTAPATTTTAAAPTP